MKLSLKKLSLLFIPLFFILFSCTSTIPNILPTYTGEEGQQYYIRQETIKKDPIKAMFDFTILMKDGQITQDVTVNYSITVKDFNPSEIENIEVTFLSDDNEFPLVFTSIILKNPQEQLVRISATLTPDQFAQLTQSTQPISVRFTHPELETIIISSKGLSEKLSEAAFLL